MDEEVERRIEYFHMILGVVAGIISGSLKENGGLFGLLIGYSGFYIVKAVFKLDSEEFPLNTWISKGAVPFLMFWLPTWIFLYNI